MVGAEEDFNVVVLVPGGGGGAVYDVEAADVVEVVRAVEILERGTTTGSGGGRMEGV